jgi:hypothetical protein
MLEVAPPFDKRNKKRKKRRKRKNSPFFCSPEKLPLQLTIMIIHHF